MRAALVHLMRTLSVPAAIQTLLLQASVRCYLIISFELLGFRHNRSVQLHPALSLEHLSVDQAEASSPLVPSVTAQHAQSQLNPRAAFY